MNKLKLQEARKKEHGSSRKERNNKQKSMKLKMENQWRKINETKIRIFETINKIDKQEAKLRKKIEGTGYHYQI